MPDTHRVPPGTTVCLAEATSRGKEYYDDRKEAERELKALRRELADLQFKLFAEAKRSLLVVLQARDAGGKDGTIRRVFEGVNPQGVRVWSFKEPTAEELSHDFLWRIHRRTPGAGMIGVFNRSHYEDVLIVRVKNLVPEEVWRPRYEHINHFERLLADCGTKILKFYLHISKEEQKKRFQQRLTDPTRNWKFSASDLEQRRYWDEYTAAYEEMLARCSTAAAPWYVIPADQKWYRNLAVARVIVHTLREMDPQFPPAAKDLDRIVVE